ncbi:hypothetical protein EZV62_007813 [Acer yangbiense]|uniref:Malic enzyme NAD-binding domain-containing protein n=1 Tax=Acer yangbiense TaxID=1000413 RepID=A0A5C7IBK5_9ROSI|nr:hypothetical protein EZV62_007813 [Acer yangbiense]
MRVVGGISTWVDTTTQTTTTLPAVRFPSLPSPPSVPESSSAPVCPSLACETEKSKALSPSTPLLFSPSESDDKSKHAKRKVSLKRFTEHALKGKLCRYWITLFFPQTTLLFRSCFLMSDFCPGGELFALHDKQPKKFFNEESARESFNTSLVPNLMEVITWKLCGIACQREQCKKVQSKHIIATGIAELHDTSLRMAAKGVIREEIDNVKRHCDEQKALDLKLQARKQTGNMYLFPGVGLGTLLSGSSIVSDGMLRAAAECLAAYMNDDDVINGKIYPSISSMRDITKQLAAAVVKEAIEEDLTESYREMDDRELKRLKKVFVAFDIFLRIDYLRKSKNMCRTTCGVQNTHMLIVIIFNHVQTKQDEKTEAGSADHHIHCYDLTPITVSVRTLRMWDVKENLPLVVSITGEDVLREIGLNAAGSINSEDTAFVYADEESRSSTEKLDDTENKIATRSARESFNTSLVSNLIEVITWNLCRIACQREQCKKVQSCVGLGTLLSGSSIVSDGMLRAAAKCLAAYMNDDDVINGKIYPSISSMRDITKQLAAAVVKEAIEEDLTEGYREMDDRELKRLKKVFVAFDIFLRIDYLRKSKNMCRTTCGVQNTHMLIVIIFNHVQTKQDEKTELVVSITGEDVLREIGLNAAGSINSEDTAFVSADEESRSSTEKLDDTENKIATRSARESFNTSLVSNLIEVITWNLCRIACQREQCKKVQSIHIVAIGIAELHDTSLRMVAKGVMREVVEWVENYSLAAYMNADDVINGKLFPAISSMRDITKQLAAAVVKEAIEEDLTESYREMDDRELKRLKKVFVAFDIFLRIDYLRKSKNMCRTTCGVQNTHKLIVIIFNHVQTKQDETTELVVSITGEDVLREIGLNAAGSINSEDTAFVSADEESRSSTEKLYDTENEIATRSARESFNTSLVSNLIEVITWNLCRIACQREQCKKVQSIHIVAIGIAELHDTSLRMAAKGVMREVVEWVLDLALFCPALVSFLMACYGLQQSVENYSLAAYMNDDDVINGKIYPSISSMRDITKQLAAAVVKEAIEEDLTEGYREMDDRELKRLKKEEIEEYVQNNMWSPEYPHVDCYHLQSCGFCGSSHSFTLRMWDVKENLPLVVSITGEDVLREIGLNAAGSINSEDTAFVSADEESRSSTEKLDDTENKIATRSARESFNTSLVSNLIEVITWNLCRIACQREQCKKVQSCPEKHVCASLLGIHIVATGIAELHDTSLRMAAKGVMREVVEWVLDLALFCPALVSFLMACYGLQQSVENYSLAAYMNDDDVINGKIYPSISSMRDITKQLAAAVVKEAIEEDLTEGYREMDDRELKRLKKIKQDETTELVVSITGEDVLREIGLNAAGSINSEDTAFVSADEESRSSTEKLDDTENKIATRSARESFNTSMVSNLIEVITWNLCRIACQRDSAKKCKVGIHIVATGIAELHDTSLRMAAKGVMREVEIDNVKRHCDEQKALSLELHARKQTGNMYLFPGVGLCTLLSGSSIVSDGMLRAAAECLAAYMNDDDVINGKIYPTISSMRDITKQLAAAVVKEAIEEDLTEGYREMDDRELKRLKKTKQDDTTELVVSITGEDVFREIGLNAAGSINSEDTAFVSADEESRSSTEKLYDNEKKIAARSASVGLGTLLSGSSIVSDGMLRAAAKCIRDITKQLAAAVVKKAIEEDLTEGYREMDDRELKRLKKEEIEEYVQNNMWSPEYPHVD